MTGRTSRIWKCTLCFLKICIFFNGEFVENIFEKKLIFFLRLYIFYGSIRCATKFHADEISLIDQKCFRFLATLVVCGTQLGNYAVGIIQMTLESAWTYEIHHFQLKCVSIYRKEVKIIAITYFLATLPILAIKLAITRYLVIVLT